MSAPGWYPDPRDPTRARYWDGRAWAPSPTPAPARPTQQRGSAWRWLVGALVAVALIVAAVFIVPRLTGGGSNSGGDQNSARPSESQWDELPTTKPPTASTSPRPSQASEVACPSGDWLSVTGPMVEGRVTGGGLSFTIDGDWSVEDSYPDMVWADDVAMVVHQGPDWWSFAGVAAIHPGGEGWDTPSAAAGLALDCMASGSVYVSVEKIEVFEDREYTVDGVTGWRLDAEVTSGSGLVDRVVVIVVPVGDERLGVFASAVKNTETQLVAEVDRAIESLRVD